MSNSSCCLSSGFCGEVGEGGPLTAKGKNCEQAFQSEPPFARRGERECVCGYVCVCVYTIPILVVVVVVAVWQWDDISRIGGNSKGGAVDVSLGGDVVVSR